MKKKILAILLAVCMIAALIPVTGVSAGAAWDGTTTDITWYTANTSASIFYISDAADLAGLSALSNGTAASYSAVSFADKTIVLTADISLSSKTFVPIGDTRTNSFFGTFDGRGHTISDISISISGGDDATGGLFGIIGSNDSATGLVANVNVSGTITCTSGAVVAGGIAGSNAGTIKNCSSSCNITSTTTGDSINHIGGIAGTSKGNIYNSFSSGALSATSQVGSGSIGGITGSLYGAMANCYTSCSISINGDPDIITAEDVGALYAKGDGTAEYCYYLSGTSIKVNGSAATPTVTYSPSCAAFTDSQGKGTANTLDFELINYYGSVSLAEALNMYAGSGDITGTTDFSGYYRWVQGTTGNSYPVLLPYDVSWYTANTAATSFLISDKADLLGLSALVNGTVPGISAVSFTGCTIMLSGDIDMSGIYFTPIGNLFSVFSGTFSGEGYTISNFTEYMSGASGGLFTDTGKRSVIRDLMMKDASVTITGNSSTAGVIVANNSGFIYSCGITNCSLSVSQTGTIFAGGISGANYGNIANSFVTGKIEAKTASGNALAGGISGIEEGGAISNCYSAASIETAYNGTASPAGCIVGRCNSLVTGCYYFASSSITTNLKPVPAASLAAAGSIERLGSVLHCYSFTDAQGKGENSGMTFFTDSQTRTGFLLTALNCWSSSQAGADYGLWMQVHGGYPTFLKMNFTDVADDQYYYSPVIWALAGNITAGTSDTTFSPNDSCTRAQAVTFIWNMAGKPEPETTECPFTDISAGDWYYKAVLWASNNGITAGTSATTFSPNNTVTRGQFVTFLWNWQGKPSHSTSNPFTDVSTTDYYYNSVLWAYENHVTSGTSGTTFSPGDNCVRAHVVTFLFNYVNNLY